MPFSYASVIEAVRLSRRLQRIVLHVDEPAALDAAHAADSTVGVYFATDGRVHPDSECRSYSIRRRDGANITIDVVMHTHGPGTRWASTAAPGHRVGLDHARSWYRPGTTAEWQLLVSDMSGMPAAARILEELPDGTPTILLIEVADRDDLGYLPQRPDVSVVPLVGTGNGDAPSRLASSVRNLDLPAGRGYCWFAGESAQSRAVRKYVRSLGWAVDQYDITGYWREDSEAWDARFAEVQDEVLPVYERALAEGKGAKLAFEEFDAACERIGL